MKKKKINRVDGKEFRPKRKILQMGVSHGRQAKHKTITSDGRENFLCVWFILTWSQSLRENSPLIAFVFQTRKKWWLVHILNMAGLQSFLEFLFFEMTYFVFYFKIFHNNKKENLNGNEEASKIIMLCPKSIFISSVADFSFWNMTKT